MWLSGLGVVLQRERLVVRFPVRAHVWVVGLDTGKGAYERQLIDVSLSLSPSFPRSLKINKVFKEIMNLVGGPVPYIVWLGAPFWACSLICTMRVIITPAS